MGEKFKFDFTKLEDQEKFDSLSKEEKVKINEEAHDEANLMQEKIKNGEVINYKEAEKDLEKEISDAAMIKVQDINKEGTAYSTIGIYQLASRGKSISELIEEKNLKNILCDGLLGDRNGPGDYLYESEVEDTTIERSRWAENSRKLHKGVVHFNIVGKGWDVNKRKNKIANSEWSHQDKIIILFNVESFKEEKPLALREDDEVYDFKHKTRTYLAATPNIKDLKKKNDEWIPKTDFGYMLAHRVAPRFFRGIVVNFASPKEGQYHFDSLKYDAISKSYFGKKIEKKEIIDQIVSTMREAFGDKKSLYLPIYDIDGDLLWPKKMNYEEVKKFLAERDKNKMNDK